MAERREDSLISPPRGERAARDRPLRRRAPAGPGGSRPVLTLGEAILGGAVLVVAAVAWSSLALAHLGHHSLGSVAGLTAVALLFAALAIRGGGVPQVRVEPVELAILVGLAGLAAVFFFPGFPYGIADKDPGVYVTHAFGIARTGAYNMADPVLGLADRIPYLQETRGFPGIWVQSYHDQLAIPQFYQLYPATLATAYEAGGQTGLVSVNPFLAMLAVGLLALVVGRAFGRLAGVLAAVLLTTNMIEVWYAKEPTTELLTQLFLIGALLGVVVVLETGWRPAALFAGVFTTLSFLTRPDGLLLVLLALVVLAALVALTRLDGRALWFAAGLALPLSHGIYQGYYVSKTYTLGASMPTLATLAFAVSILFAVALAIRFALGRLSATSRRTLSERVRSPRTQRTAGGVVTVLGALFVAVGFLRPTLFGMDTGLTPDGRLIRTFREESLLRISWFFTAPGIVVAVIGLAVVALRRWQAAAWAVVLPGLVLLPVYVWNPRIYPQLMWWTRRFVPVGIVILVVLIAVAFAWLLTRPGRPGLFIRIGTAAWAVVLVSAFVQMSWPLRSHHEYGGSFDITRRISETSEGRGIYLWQQYQSLQGASRNFGAPLWFEYDEVSALLPSDATPEVVEVFRRAFPGLPLFVVTDRLALPKGLARLDLRIVLRIRQALPKWEETYEDRPDRARPFPVDLTVWRLYP